MIEIKNKKLSEYISNSKDDHVVRFMMQHFLLNERIIALSKLKIKILSSLNESEFFSTSNIGGTITISSGVKK